MDKKKIGIAIGCAAVIVVIAICAVTFGGKKADVQEHAATLETAATAEPAATPEVTAAPQPVVTAAPQPAQQEPSSDDGGEVPDWYDDSWTGYDDEITGWDGVIWE